MTPHALVRILLAFVLACLAALPASAQGRTYENEALAAMTRQVEAQIADETPRPDRASLDLLREGRAFLESGAPRDAAWRFAEAIRVNPESYTLWSSYARAALAIPYQDWSERWQMQERATVAAYIAYGHAENATEAADALAALGEAFAAREMWRDALTAYKASLATRADARVQAVHDDLRTRYGFRILDYRVESDTPSPRVCFVFSEPLTPRVDLTPYVAVAGASGFAVTSEGNEACVDGLVHGERYAIVLRPGIPSTVDEVLERAGDYEVYIRDRAPQARFTGRNYVLPRLGQEGIPVVSTNTDEVAVAIYRIGDRNLLPTLRGGDFLDQIASWTEEEIAAERGAPIWSGTLDVAMERNVDVVTAFPVSEAVGALEPGVYVMTARADASVEPQNDWGPRATQWFVVSDIGLTAFSASDGVHVLLRSLATAEPIAGASVALVARNNEVLGESATDESGYVRFDPGLARGEEGLGAGMVTAQVGGDYGFLDLGQAPFDLTDRGVAGRPATGALDAMLFPERGVYRSGEEVHLTAVLRDAQARAVPAVPLTLIVRRPDGIEHARILTRDEGEGGRVHTLPLLPDAMPGTWRVSAHVDPEGQAIGDTVFLVEDYVPERIALDLTPRAPAIAPGARAEIDLSARYLFGAPGVDLVVSGEVSVSAAQESAVPGLAGYVVGLTDEPVEGAYAALPEESRTGADGTATIAVSVPAPAAARPLSAEITLRVAEAGGRAVARSVTLPILPQAPVIGVKALETDLAEGDVAAFDVVAARPDGSRLAGEAQWSLLKVERRYQWYQTGGQWGFEPVTTTERIASGTIALSPDAPARIEAPVSWGAHRLEVVAADPAVAPTSLGFDVGWSGDATARAPDLLPLTLDRADYAAGDTLVATIDAAFEGEATIAIVSDRVHALETIPVTGRGTRAELTVSEEWGAGAYLVAIAHRPLDATARRQPGRAMGLAWFGVDRAARDLAMTLSPPDEIRPRGDLTIPVRLANLAPGERAFVTLAAVDVGILALTNYEAPDATEHFLGQKRLGAEVRDLYGYLIDGMQGTRGAIRSGGDSAPAGLAAPPPDQPPLALHSGIVEVGPDGTAEMTFAIPAFNGTVRVIGVAWSAGKVGDATVDVLVRDPVVVAATAPRFLNAEDESRLHVRLDNVSGPAGRYTLEALPLGSLDIAIGERLVDVMLGEGANAEASFPLVAGAPGDAGVSVTLTGPDGLSLTQEVAVPVAPGTEGVVRREIARLAPGASLRITDDLLADIQPGTGLVSVAVTPIGRLDPPGMIQALQRYPYGCTEQLVSQALPLLYAGALVGPEALELPRDREETIRSVVAQVLGRQTASGSFGLWSASSYDDLWLTAYAADFLTRAREEGFEAPQAALDRALERLRNHVANTTEVEGDDGAALAYAAYVLARNGRPVMGDLRYLADARIDAFETPLARAQIGAGLALLGDTARAETAFGAALTRLAADETRGRGWRADYGSRLRDAAGILALVGEADVGQGAVKRLAGTIDEESARSGALSTQEMAWLAVAARSVAEEAESIVLDVSGETLTGPLYDGFDAGALAGGGVSIRNDGASGVEVAITVTGNPFSVEPALSQGFEIARSYFDLEGNPVDPTRVVQNTRLVTVLDVVETTDDAGRLLVVDRLPAGFEIDNPALVTGSEVAALPWLSQDRPPDRAEFRDDRFVAAFDSLGSAVGSLRLAYVVRTVAPGTYLHPPASAEDMYRPERFGRTGAGTVTVVPAR
ncbi:alpha-2-macroglobulin family protein [Salinarimonas ramus]|uniref:Alpha-2-macroglobulin n=1 Tax=Salinarimonas ramus TaxID=690164 RepID=A0A917V7W8_9HYPH|nr:alpha-2-macroglobulin [Salinarimonas ramus]GGK48602.1 alpha-2-macroglobulin [Salinarimonas ramus]